MKDIYFHRFLHVEGTLNLEEQFSHDHHTINVWGYQGNCNHNPYIRISAAVVLKNNKRALVEGLLITLAQTLCKSNTILVRDLSINFS